MSQVELPTEADPVRLVQGDALEVLRSLPDGCVDAVVTDPPAGISFMSKTWDDPKSYGFKDGWRNGAPPTVNLGRNPTCRACGGRQRAGPKTRACDCAEPAFNGRELIHRDRAAFVGFLTAVLAECLRATKPGGRLLCWAIPRTAHWTATAVEDAGWVVENKVYHLFGTGFPKGKSQLKPAAEEWVLARKPGKRVLPLGIDECRVAMGEDYDPTKVQRQQSGRQTWGDGNSGFAADHEQPTYNAAGRYPANVLHDGSDEVLEAFAAFGERPGATSNSHPETANGLNRGGALPRTPGYADTGSAARFYYTAKASQEEREAAADGTRHPTQKPVELMRWLVRLVTPRGGLALDPFAGSGTTGVAALIEGRQSILIEREPSYCDIIRKRLARASGTGPGSLFAGTA